MTPSTPAAGSPGLPHVGSFRRTGERLIHQGHLWKVVVADYESPDGSAFTRDVVRSPGAVGVVPLLFDAEGNPFVVLVRQWRPALEREIWEIPAGMRDVPGEPPEVTGGRELVEEVGYRAGRLALLAEMLPSPGLTDAVTHIYLATDLAPATRELHGPEEEHSTMAQLPFEEAIAMVERGDISDAKSCLGLLLTERRLLRSDASPTA
jgi:8-oxo-dGTP pyrophosphatase MutT (NUDIX family)